MEQQQRPKPFPFNTCEERRSVGGVGVDQPYSASINIVSCIILLYLLSLAKHIEIQFLYCPYSYSKHTTHTRICFGATTS